MKVSVVIDTGRPWSAVRELARQVAEQGVYTVFVPDHFMEHSDDGSPSDGPMLEAWTVLSALAVEVSGVRLGPLVLSASHRHPAVVAKDAATIDVLTGGRLELGLGGGWLATDYAKTGIPHDPPVLILRHSKSAQRCRAPSLVMPHRCRQQ